MIPRLFSIAQSALLSLAFVALLVPATKDADAEEDRKLPKTELAMTP